jgi:hypothetical protein
MNATTITQVSQSAGHKGMPLQRDVQLRTFDLCVRKTRGNIKRLADEPKSGAWAASALISNLVSATGTKLEFYNLSNTITPLVQASNVTVGGSCMVRITGTDGLAAGGTYPLIKYAGTFTGTFADYQLEMPYGWRGTLVNSSKQISLANVDVVATDSPTMTVTNSGSQIQFSWPATHIGWRLHVQTNSASTGLGTNWGDAADVSSTNKVMVPTSSTIGSVFYRLIYP